MYVIQVSVDDGDVNIGLHMSSCSLASTSSSSGSSLGAKSKPALTNGSAVPMKTSSNAVPVNMKIGNGGNLITKSISFDKTAELGDKEEYDEDGKNKKGFFKNIKFSFKKGREKWYRNDELG